MTPMTSPLRERSGVPIAQAGVTVFELCDGLVAEIRPSLDRERTLTELGLADA